MLLKADSFLLILKRERVPLSIMGLTAAQKPQVFSPQTPDKPQLAERLLTKNQGNAAPLHHLLPITLYSNLAPLSLGESTENKNRAPNPEHTMCPCVSMYPHNFTHVSATNILDTSSLYLHLILSCLH